MNTVTQIILIKSRPTVHLPAHTLTLRQQNVYTVTQRTFKSRPYFSPTSSLTLAETRGCTYSYTGARGGYMKAFRVGSCAIQLMKEVRCGCSDVTGATTIRFEQLTSQW